MIGSPSEEELGFITSEKAKRYIRSLPRSERVDFSQLWPHVTKPVRRVRFTISNALSARRLARFPRVLLTSS